MTVPEAEKPTPLPSRMVGRNIMLFQGFVILFSLFTMLVFFGSIADYYETLRTECILQECDLASPATTLAELQSYHLTLDSYAMLLVIIDCSLTILFYLAALIILWKCFREPMALLGALMLVAFGTTFPSLVWIVSEGQALLLHWHDFVAMTGWSSFALFCFLFPDGRFTPRWTAIIFILLCLENLLSFLFPGTMIDQGTWPFFVKGLWHITVVAVEIYSQVYRFRKVSLPPQRQQTKWVVYGLSTGLAGFIGISLLFNPDYGWGVMEYVYLNAVLHLFLLLIPLTMSLAVLRHRLWDIDPLVNRTLVYGALSVCVVVVYTLSVLYLSRLFETEDNYVISLLATSLVAVLFAPLKERLQRVVNRLMKGRHDDPYAVLVEWGNHLLKPIAPDAMLIVVVDTIKDALRLPYTGISIGLNGQDRLVASAGEPTDDVHAFPIIHRGEELGTLFVASRSPGEAFSTEDHKLLEVLQRQAGPVVQNVNMTVGMKLLAEDLQESREKLVLAREEERRQIRRNLHDDLAPRLAALALNAATAEKYVKKDPDIATELLAELRKVIRSTVDEIRTLVHDLRPPTLDELGLIGAIQERISDLSKTNQHLSDANEFPLLEIELQAPPQLPSLPAAVEVAAYRIITESMVNVVRHAKAAHCTVRLELSPTNQLRIEIKDDGTGIIPLAKPSGKGGIGLGSIRERAAELGGQCTIERVDEGGTRVLAILPFQKKGEEGT